MWRSPAPINGEGPGTDCRAARFAGTAGSLRHDQEIPANLRPEESARATTRRTTSAGSQPSESGRRGKRDLTFHHRIAEHAKPLDLNLDHIPRSQENGRLARHADAGRRARENQIPRLERENLRKIADYRADREYHLSSVAVLHYFAVKAQADREFVRIRNLVRRHERGPGWGKRVESLAGHPLLAVFLELPIACRDVV